MIYMSLSQRHLNLPTIYHTAYCVVWIFLADRWVLEFRVFYTLYLDTG